MAQKMNKTAAESNTGRSEDPERLVGIPLFSSFISEDEDAAIFRNFSRLGARNLLHLQNRLNELEFLLDEFDRKDAERAQGQPSLRLGAKAYDSLREAALRYERKLGVHAANGNDALELQEELFQKEAYERINLHLEIRVTLQKYRQAILEEHQSKSLPKPSKRALATFKKYFTDGGNILIGYDKKIIQEEKDLVALGQCSNDDRLSRMVRYTCGYCLKTRKSTRQHHTDIFYFPPRRVQILAYSITAILCGILLIGAMACLSVLYDRSLKLRIGMVALFTFLFASFISFLTNARRTEVFGATAAYAAVLVVYVSAGLGPGSSPSTHGMPSA